MLHNTSLKTLGLIGFLILQGCEEHIGNYSKVSPNGRYIVHFKEKLAPAFSSNRHWISVARIDGSTVGELKQIFHGNGDFPIVYWSSPHTLMIIYCAGTISDLDSWLYVPAINDESNRNVVFTQVITASGIKINDQNVCDRDPVTGYWTEEGLEANKKLREFWREKQPWTKKPLRKNDK